RVLPTACKAVIKKGSWPVHPIFTIIGERGGVDAQEMFRVFNMGIGMVLVVAENDAPEVMERLEKMGEKVYSIGVIEKRAKDEPSVIFG
ncbi:MAG: AIR synthase-related protein, partial [Syntrophales bacterium]|nr:AIR synthase-related protein [Syntrophales bacterium]